MSFYPLQTNIYENDISRRAKSYEAQLVNNSFKKGQNAPDEGVIPRFYNQNILNKTNKFKIHEQLKDIKEYDKNSSEMISTLSGEKIPIDKFNHNNMVPFFGSNIKQNTSDDFSHNKLEQFTGSNKHFRNKSESKRW